MNIWRSLVRCSNPGQSSTLFTKEEYLIATIVIDAPAPQVNDLLMSRQNTMLFGQNITCFYFSLSFLTCYTRLVCIHVLAHVNFATLLIFYVLFIICANLETQASSCSSNNSWTDRHVRTYTTQSLRI